MLLLGAMVSVTRASLVVAGTRLGDGEFAGVAVVAAVGAVAIVGLRFASCI